MANLLVGCAFWGSDKCALSVPCILPSAVLLEMKPHQGINFCIITSYLDTTTLFKALVLLYWTVHMLINHASGCFILVTYSLKDLLKYHS